jgi:hypothetical protein
MKSPAVIEKHYEEVKAFLFDVFSADASIPERELVHYVWQAKFQLPIYVLIYVRKKLWQDGLLFIKPESTGAGRFWVRLTADEAAREMVGQ